MQRVFPKVIINRGAVPHMQQPFDPRLKNLAARLDALGYAGLFQQADRSAIEGLYSEPGMVEALGDMLRSPQTSEKTAFLAGELLYAQHDWVPEFFRIHLGPAYAAALAGNFTGDANHWGIPGITEGILERHIVDIGKHAIAPLKPLLDDRTRLHYAGSKESTVGERLQLRVKDLAAYFLARITGAGSFGIEGDPAARDQSIGRLRAGLR